MMRPLLLTIIFSCCSSLLFCQENSLSPQDFDFWLGEWRVEWEESDGKTGSGTNIIEKIMDGSVIQERFSITQGGNAGFKGTSISVFDPRQKVWRQAWADSQGGYFSFTGSREGDKRMFSTTPQETAEGTIIQRMVFYNISEDAFTWDWESSKDGGETWALSWRIQYTRKE